MENIFDQGSCDAVLVAWLLMDAESKRKKDCFSSDYFIEGINLSQMSFVDDLIEFSANVENSNERSVTSEVFEKKTRSKFKMSKCKTMSKGKEKADVCLKGEVMEKVSEHVYLGTVISDNGERFTEMNSRIKQSNGVANEIEQICIETELAPIRLRYVKLLTNSCLDSKLKFGCALWNITKYKNTTEKLNRIKPKIIKRVMQLPQATPSAAIQYEFGVNDLSLEVLMEKVILAVEILKLTDERVSKKILEALMEKEVPGFCSEVAEACKILDVCLESLLKLNNVREHLKKIILELQAEQLFTRMVVSSKMDGALLQGFLYDGKIKMYLTELSFREARAIFMSRYRMWPTKANFPGRWEGLECNICGMDDTDDHVCCCPGYKDIVPEGMNMNIFWDDDLLGNVEKLKSVAQCVIQIIDRMESLQKLS